MTVSRSSTRSWIHWYSESSMQACLGRQSFLQQIYTSIHSEILIFPNASTRRPFLSYIEYIEYIICPVCGLNVIPKSDASRVGK